jgi:hypothetical protein
VKHPAFTLASLAPSTDVLEAFLALGRKMKPDLAMIECRNITERMVKARVQDTILPQIREAFSMHAIIHGDPDIHEKIDMDEWTDAMDDAIEALFGPYSNSLTLDFMGRATIDTRLHQSSDKVDECEVLAAAFANDVWRVLIHDGDEDSETHVLSTAKILSAVGIVKDDLIEILGDMPEPTPAQTAQAMKELHMKSMNEIFNELYEFWGGEFNEKEMREYFEMAIDRDDILANSGLVPMGLDMEAAPTLRMFAAKYGAKAIDEFITGVRGAPYEDDVTDSHPAVYTDSVSADGSHYQVAGEPEEETDPEMREMMGLPPLEPYGHSPAMSALGIAPTAPAGTLAGVLNRPAGVPAPTLPRHITGTIDKRALELIRKHVKRKDEDIASGLGVARQTYINYADPAKKATLVASEAQGAYLKAMLEEEMAGLQKAYDIICGA